MYVLCETLAKNVFHACFEKNKTNYSKLIKLKSGVNIKKELNMLKNILNKNFIFELVDV